MWMVWASGSPIEYYNQYIGRFDSEFGMQGMIPMSSMRQFSTPADWNLDSFVVKIHERHPQGWQLIPQYMNDYFRPIKDFESYVYGTMVMQSYAVLTGIEALRRSQPFTMGSLYWQINDVWPVFSWASVDFYGQWKALHFRAREAYKNVAVFIHPTQVDSPGSFTVSVVNDNLMTVSGNLLLEVYTFSG